MQTNLSPQFKDAAWASEAEAILRKCVHCGFCTATCPSYQVLGDELDSPRGRIYLIKRVLEGEAPTQATQLHLDRCLTCRNCESTCPSGVQYGHLVDIGRDIVEQKVPRGVGSTVLRWALKEGLTSPLFAPAMKLGQLVRGALPQRLKEKVPQPQAAGKWPARKHARKVLLLKGCVQPAMMPNIDSATARVLDAIGIQCVTAKGAGCCGAVKFHLNDQEGGLAHMRANIDAWWPLVERGEVEAIVINASGCSVTVKEYGHHLRHDARYAQRAARVSELAKDLSELLPQIVEALRGKVQADSRVLGYHAPCTLQHGMQLKGGVENGLSQLGFTVRVALNESHLCCGSAGTYSVLHPDIAHELRDRKLANLQAVEPQELVSANIGCITHLQSGTALPVRHWIEVLDAALAARQREPAPAAVAAAR